MSMGTFDAFTSARLGIYAAQYGLKVTGNNVSNINTEGYTRQRLDQVSFKAGAYDRYRSQLDNHVGSGALVMNINQIRDPYLDVRYRNTSAEVGYHDAMLAGLQEVADILDEVGLGENASDNEEGDGLLHAQLQDLADKLRAYEKEPTKANNDLVRTSAEILCGLFNKYAQKLEGLRQDTEKDFNDQVTEINECLTNIRDLNREIRDCEIYGDTALELRDERNRQIDKLSEYIPIKVVYTEEEIGGAQKVEKLSIFLANKNPDASVTTDTSMLVDGIYGAQLHRLPQRNKNYDPDDPATGGPYLTEDGTTTDDITKAALQDPENYLLTISKLVDDKGRDWKGVTTSYEEVPAADLAGPFLPKGEIGDKNAAGWTLAKKAEAAIYSFDFTPSGTQWIAGNKFVISGTTYTVGDTAAGADISVDDANDPAGLAAFIAEKLGKDPKYDGKYTVATDPANPTTILFTAVTPGAIPVSERPNTPDITVIDPTGKLNFSRRQIENAGEDAALEPPPGTTVTDPATGKETITSYAQLNGKWNKVTTEIEHTREVDLDDNDLYGSLQATRELLTEKGEFSTPDTIRDIDEDAEEKRGIPYYQLSLDLLAREFAKQYNQINQGYALDENGNYIHKTGKTDEDGNPIYEKIPEQTVTYYEDEDGNYVGLTAQNPTDKEVTATLNSNMSANAKQAFEENFEANGTSLKEFLDQNGEPMGGVLFSWRNDKDDPEGITASNISVAHKWSTGEVELVPKYEILFGGSLDHSTQNNNARLMLNMIDKPLVYNPQDMVAGAVSNKLFEGNFNDMFDRMNTICGQDIRANNISLNTSYGQLVEIDTMRDGVSGVDLNDEAMNMMQFQKALNAAMRMMTVVDEALDRLINNTGIAGR